MIAASSAGTSGCTGFGRIIPARTVAAIRIPIERPNGQANPPVQSTRAPTAIGETMPATPKPVWNPDIPQAIDFFDTWQEMPETRVFDNGFKSQWEMFLKHVVEDGPWPYGLEAGAKGVQLAMAGLQSWQQRRWIDVPALAI